MGNKVIFFISLLLILLISFDGAIFENNPSESNYHDLALADDGLSLPRSTTFENYDGSEVTTLSYRAERAKQIRAVFAPAIPVLPIGKFLNGNLPVGTPDDVSGPFAPALLSQTGAFSDLASLTASDGVVPYEMIEPFWSDGASKSRWMAVPNDGTHDTADEQVVFSDTEAWDFPRGSVLIKHFELGGKRLETRFEVKGDDDVYYYLTYKWNAAQTDAELLVGSLDEDVDVDGTVQSWHYPSRAECVSCHFPQNGGVLGPKTRNLNKTITYPGGVSANQLANLSEMGIIAENITEANAGNYMAVAAKDDLSRSSRTGRGATST
ncbi:hypothetical protein [Maribacter aestuarii]|uniref:hypothetical protein n=1 Tax=Maribacter aestuarii TaxID=1130723 RepID=UPI0025A50441|nr:hypothetical protein [Maribacter aestuarii]